MYEVLHMAHYVHQLLWLHCCNHIAYNVQRGRAGRHWHPRRNSADATTVSGFALSTGIIEFPPIGGFTLKEGIGVGQVDTQWPPFHVSAVQVAHS